MTSFQAPLLFENQCRLAVTSFKAHVFGRRSADQSSIGKKWMKRSGRNAEGSEEHGDELLGDMVIYRHSQKQKRPTPLKFNYRYPKYPKMTLVFEAGDAF